MKTLAGYHLIIDGYVRDEAVLGKAPMLKLFDRLVKSLNMRYLVKPQAATVPPNENLLDTESDEGGTSFWCMITTSHIAAHTWPLKKAVMLDIFSCRVFDSSVARQIIEDHFQFESSEVQIVHRGTSLHMNAGVKAAKGPLYLSV